METLYDKVFIGLGICVVIDTIVNSSGEEQQQTVYT